MLSQIFYFGESHLTPALAMQLAKGTLHGVLGKSALDKIKKSHEDTLAIAAGNQVVYGVNTGFGPLCDTRISTADTIKLQENILRSHSVGVGNAVPEIVVRLMLIIKIHALSMGYSGIARTTLERMIWMLDENVLPVVPNKGSVGASGDLAPLAHLSLPLIGLGKVTYKGQEWETAKLFQKLNLSPIQLGPKEGLALINGTQFIAGYATWGLHRMQHLLDAADIIGAMSLEGVLGSISPFKKELHDIRPFEGSRYVAYRLHTLLQDSEMVASHKDCGRVQDPYSIRCMPQVHGASRNAWAHLHDLTTVELNAVTDNPIILNREETISGGNFHGQLLALPLDYCALAAAELGNISDRRTYLLLEGKVAGLPRLLMKNTGINSGFMIPQYTSAALVSENKSLLWPASADSIPTSLGQEDHVSMGSISSRKFNRVMDNLEYILAIELICAAQAFDYHKPLKSGVVLEACHQLLRDSVSHAEEDRIFGDDIALAHDLIKNEQLVSVAREAAATHKIDLLGEFGQKFEL